MSRYLFAVTCVLTFALSQSFAQGLKFNVRLRVSCDGCADSVRSCLARELRKFPSLVVTDDEPDFELNVVAMEARGQTGYSAGYVMAVLVLDFRVSRFYASNLESLGLTVRYASPACPEEARTRLDKSVKTLVESTPRIASLAAYWNLGIRIFPADALVAECRDVVAEFAGSHLGARRTPAPR